jgi:DNA-binding Xre family transcriptional regulator
MPDKIRGSERTQRSREISAIKKQGRNGRGRGVPLPGLWAARAAAGLTQRELAMLVGSSQGTITSLELMSRGAYPKTLRRLCSALKVEPIDLLRAEATEDLP